MNRGCFLGLCKQHRPVHTKPINRQMHCKVVGVKTETVKSVKYIPLVPCCHASSRPQWMLIDKGKVTVTG